MERQDASALVTAILQKEAGTNMPHSSYKLLKCKETASKREIEAITKKSYLVLHPDQQGFITVVAEESYHVGLKHL